MTYRGRFAPSPTGPLHFGSLVAAVASYLDARAANGEWLVRMEDIDTPRTVAGADGNILLTLEKFGLQWDGDVVYQSHRTHLYRAALEKLKEKGAAYPCSCSRREVGGEVYPGTCRNGPTHPERALSWRVRSEDAQGDFVVLRSDGIFAYQLAVVVDDAEQGITHIVRGADLLDSTPRQNELQDLLGYPRPQYLHVPVATDASGAKLSKETFAAALDADTPVKELKEALRFLAQKPVDAASPQEILRTAALQWNRSAIPQCFSLPRE